MIERYFINFKYWRFYYEKDFVISCSFVFTNASKAQYWGGYYPPNAGAIAGQQAGQWLMEQMIQQGINSINWDAPAPTTTPAPKTQKNIQTNDNNPSSTTTRPCSYCKNGRVMHESSVPSYGQTPYRKRCNECGFEYMSTTNHYHSACRHCGGKGYVVIR